MWNQTRGLVVGVAVAGVLAASTVSGVALTINPNALAAPRSVFPQQLHPRAPQTRFHVVGGELKVSPTVIHASEQQAFHFSIKLIRPVRIGTLFVELPELWVMRSSVSGLRYAHPVHVNTEDSHADFRHHGRHLEIRFHNATPQDHVRFTIVDNGLPAGEYTLRFFEHAGGGKRIVHGAAHVKIVMETFADEQSSHASASDRNNGSSASTAALANPGGAVSATTGFAFEPAIVAPPNDPARIVVGAGTQNPGVEIVTRYWLSTNQGGSWVPLPESDNTVITREGASEAGVFHAIADPVLAADDRGNIWRAAVVTKLPGRDANSRIALTRMPSGATEFMKNSVGLDRVSGANALQDKPAITVDNSPTSPTYGRIYVVWNPLGSTGGHVVISYCDTRGIGGVNEAANCDRPAGWTAPIQLDRPVAANGNVLLFGENGSTQFPSVATAPDGKAYVVWWDGSANNAIFGTTCNAGANDPQGANERNRCDRPTDWTEPEALVHLAAVQQLLPAPHGQRESIPAKCATPATPNSRASPDPSVAVDNSALGSATRGRVYLVWSDLDLNLGTTHCHFQPIKTNPNNIEPAKPASTDAPFKSYVASAVNSLPHGGPSKSLGTQVRSPDGLDASLLPVVTVDRQGGATIGYYSTIDPAREETKFMTQAIAGFDGTKPILGQTQAVSPSGINFHDRPKDPGYGDYAGITSACDAAQPVHCFAYPSFVQLENRAPGARTPSIFTWIPKVSGSAPLLAPAPERRVRFLAVSKRVNNGPLVAPLSREPEGISFRKPFLLSLGLKNVGTQASKPDAVEVTIDDFSLERKRLASGFMLLPAAKPGEVIHNEPPGHFPASFPPELRHLDRGLNLTIASSLNVNCGDSVVVELKGKAFAEVRFNLRLC